MMKRMISMGLLVTFAIAAYVWSTSTTESEASDGDQDKQTDYERGKDLAEQRGSEQAMPSQEEMMQAWMEYATPGEHHAKLEAWVGNWQIQSKMWPMPGAPLEESTMYSEAHMMMDGRYLHERSTGEFDMGGGEMMSFEGKALIGYDNHKGEYFSHWIDNFGTGIWIETGNFNDEGQLVTTGKVFNPMFGKALKSKSVFTLIDNDTRKLEMWMNFPGTGMFKHMELTYTRQ